MKIYYISPSTIPSRSANSIHVVNMCEALVQLGHEVTLFARSDNSITINNNEYLDNFYGVNSDGIELNIFFTKSAKGIELLISIRAFVVFILNCLKYSSPYLIIS